MEDGGSEADEHDTTSQAGAGRLSARSAGAGDTRRRRDAPGLAAPHAGLAPREVAQLSGVGVTWYTWLEQGRPINASPQVLDAVARTLRLDQTEREHLYHLAERPTRKSRAGAPRADRERGDPGHHRRLRSAPGGGVYNSRYDILAANPPYRDLFFVPQNVDIGVPNVLWTLFTVPSGLPRGVPGQRTAVDGGDAALRVRQRRRRARLGGLHTRVVGRQPALRRVVRLGRPPAGTAREDVPP